MNTHNKMDLMRSKLLLIINKNEKQFMDNTITIQIRYNKMDT